MADILIADDNPHVRHMAEEILAPEGHRVNGVPDGKAALRCIREANPDLVLLDTKMPRADGLEVCRDIRADPGAAGVRVVMLAGPLEPLDSEGAGAQGFDAVLQKPLDADSLLKTVNELLGGRGGGDAVSSAQDAAAPAEVDPLTHLVEETLLGRQERFVESEIRRAVGDAMAAALPGVVERVTVEVSRKLKRI